VKGVNSKNFLGSLVLGSVLGYFALLTGFWYALVITGFVSGLLQKKLVHAFVALFLAGVLSTLLVLLPLFKDGLIRLMEVVGAVIGINGVALLLLTLLISGLMSGAGALIAASLRSFKSL
jgi:hypothetical protein